MKKIFVIVFILILITLLMLHPSDTGRAANIYDNLISCWDLDEESGTRDDAYGTNDLTDINTVGSASGIIGKAASFNPLNNEYLRKMDTDNSLDGGNADYTFAFWISTRNNTTSAQLINKINGVSDYAISQDSSGHINFYIGNGATWQAIVNDTTINLTTWYFVIVWVDSVSHKYYIQINDGTPKEGSILGTPITNDSQFDVGSFSGTGNFDGLLDEIAFWKRTLDNTERTWLYNSGSGRSCTALQVIPTATPTITFTPTVTQTPTPTLTPTPTSTPSGMREITLPSGNYMTLDRQASYGDIAIVCIGSLVLLLALLYILVRIPKLWLR